MKTEFNFKFADYPSRLLIREKVPLIRELKRELYPAGESSENLPVLAICDTNTEKLARKVLGEEEQDQRIKLLVLESGEKSKSLEIVETILRAALDAELGRDGLFIGIGGGVIGDLTSFAASVYMRGAKLCLVSTTLLGMVDAGLGGKTGIDFSGYKNLVGTFYPAGLVYLPLAALNTLPEKEWKSGMAELIKTAILDSKEFLNLVKELFLLEEGGKTTAVYRECLKECISRSVAYKGRIVEADPKETGTMRPLLNLGHTFGHALEKVVGLGVISHGEAVAWGIARACKLGLALGITPLERAREITKILVRSGYETRAPHPLAGSIDSLMNAMMADKKQKSGHGHGAAKLRFIVPGAESARVVSAADMLTGDTPSQDETGVDMLLRKILSGE